MGRKTISRGKGTESLPGIVPHSQIKIESHLTGKPPLMFNFKIEDDALPGIMFEVWASCNQEIVSSQNLFKRPLQSKHTNHGCEVVDRSILIRHSEKGAQQMSTNGSAFIYQKSENGLTWPPIDHLFPQDNCEVCIHPPTRHTQIIKLGKKNQ